MKLYTPKDDQLVFINFKDEELNFSLDEDLKLRSLIDIRKFIRNKKQSKKKGINQLQKSKVNTMRSNQYLRYTML